MALEHLGPIGIAYAVGIFAVGLLAAFIAGYAWRRRETPGASSLAALMVGVTVWNLSKFAQVFARNSDVVYVFEFALLLAVGLVVASFLTLVVEFTGRAHLLTRRTILLLAVEPALLFVLATTNGWHGLVWRSVETGEAITPVFGFGPVFWLHAVYSFVLLLVGVGLLVQQLTRQQSVYRRQAGLILLGTVVPMIANVLSLSGVTDVDLTPVGFAVTGAAVAWAITQDRLIDLVPIAREQVVETLTDPVFVVDERGRITDCNEAATTLVWAADEELIGTEFQTVLAGFPSLNAETPESLAATETVEIHTGLGHRTFEVRGTPLTDEREVRRGQLFVFQDVTERETSRRELEHQNEQLERFASVVSHDLRNPLSVAEGYLELARETGDDEHFEAIDESLERMNAIIDDVLALARDGSRIEEREPTSLAEVAETAWNQVATGDDELVLAEDATVAADPDRLQRLFENCFRNAMEHGHDPDSATPLTVTVGAIAPEDAGAADGPDVFGFFVEDDGVGIPEEHRESIFEPGHTSSDGGTGLGLSIVQGIAEAHGWTVRATAATDSGARFEFTGAQPVSHQVATTEPERDGAQR